MVVEKVVGGERPRSVEEWITQIEFSWRNIPELEVSPELLEKELKHLVIICDGNRRAARSRGFHPWDGHQAGVEAIKGIARASREWGIKTLTFWTWSTENWEREEEQVKVVMNLAAAILEDNLIINELTKNQVKFTHLGRKDRLPLRVRQSLTNLERQTKNLDRYRLNLAMDYGGFDEIARGIKKMFADYRKRKFDLETLEEKPSIILDFLDTSGQLLPDLIIRTGVTKEEIPHTSGFMPLQATYACWMFLSDFFPDLTPQSLKESIIRFLEYKRRKGK